MERVPQLLTPLPAAQAVSLHAHLCLPKFCRACKYRCPLYVFHLYEFHEFYERGSFLHHKTQEHPFAPALEHAELPTSFDNKSEAKLSSSRELVRNCSVHGSMRRQWAEGGEGRGGEEEICWRECYTE